MYRIIYEHRRAGYLDHIVLEPYFDCYLKRDVDTPERFLGRYLSHFTAGETLEMLLLGYGVFLGTRQESMKSR